MCKLCGLVGWISFCQFLDQSGLVVCQLYGLVEWISGCQCWEFALSLFCFFALSLFTLCSFALVALLKRATRVNSSRRFLLKERLEQNEWIALFNFFEH